MQGHSERYRISFSKVIRLFDNLGEKFALAVSHAAAGFNLFSSASNQKIISDFKRAGMQAEPLKNYLSGSLAISTAFFTVFAVALLCMDFYLFDSIAISLALSCVAFLAFSCAPSLLAARVASQCESELPFLLREFAVYLDIGLPFEKCLQMVSKRDYLLSMDFASAFQEIRSGATVQAALSKISSESRSMPLKRSIYLLSSIYETGASSEQLKRMAEDLSGAQISRLRLQGGKLALFSVLFICVSALVPAFFCIMTAVSPFFGPPIAAWAIWLAFLLIFPLLDAAILCAMFFALPSSSQNFSSSAGVGAFLAKIGFPYGVKPFVLILAAISLGLAAFALLLGQSVLSVLLLCTAPCAYALALYASQKEASAAETYLPDALYSAAAVHKVLSPEKMLAFLAKGGFGKLSEAFETALRRQRAGESFSSSMEHALLQCRTFLTQRAFCLLIVSYETGADMGLALREAASDAASFFSLIRERSSAMAVQHYTILAASSFLVPFILGTVLSMVPSLSASAAISGMASGGNPSTDLIWACQLYLLACSFFSAIALSFSSGDSRSSILYFSFIAPVSQAVFAFASYGVAFLVGA